MVAQKRRIDLLCWLSRGSFALSFLLAMSTPSWDAGTFSYLPLLRFRFSGQRFEVGMLVLLPLVTAATWTAARLVQRPALRWRWGPRHVLLPLLGFGAWSLIRIWPVHIQRAALVTAVSIAVLWGTYFYLLQERGEQWALWLVAAFVALQGTIAVLQFARQDAVGLSALGELAIDPQGQGMSVIEAGGRRWLRAYGLTPHPNVLGGYLAMGLLVCLAALLLGQANHRRWLWIPVVLGMLGLFVTFSRAAWLGAGIGIVFMSAMTRLWRVVDVRSRRVRQRIWLAGILLALTGVVLGLAYRDLLVTRFLRLGSPLEATSIQERLVDYRQAWGLIRAVPLKGTGSGYYVDALWAGVGEDRPPGFRRVHNTFLLAAAELGVGGALLWTWLLLVAPVTLARQGDRARSALAGWAAALVAAAVTGLFDSYLYVPSTWWPALYLGLILGGWACTYDRIGEQVWDR
jgi:O-antigen ligase